MLQYLVILLDDTSLSYCHYENNKTERRLIDIGDLKSGVLYAMKENLNIQFVYPTYDLPQEYQNVIESIDHTNIGGDNANVIILDDFKLTNNKIVDRGKNYILRVCKNELFANYQEILSILDKVSRLNVVICDIDQFTENDFEMYKDVLSKISEGLISLYVAGKSPQLNILTDRMMLTEMNNCGAGDTNITLAPNGKFYVCPAFYLEDEADDIGSLKEGLNIKNRQLYLKDHAPICRVCDAFHCKRCIWMNRRTTLEVNTPSHEQCVVSHLERNAARQLLLELRLRGEFLPEQDEIKEIAYIDPIDNIEHI